MWIEREIHAVADRAQRESPAILLTGSRQVGKTSLLEHGFPGFGYVSLDLPAVAEEAEGAGAEFLRRHPRPLIIDEVQYAPLLFRYLKSAIDERRDENGQFLLTGSQKLALMERVSESLAGRVAVIQMHSLSLGEIEEGVRQAVELGARKIVILGGGEPCMYPHLRELIEFLDQAGVRVPAGVLFARLEAGSRVAVRKLLLSRYGLLPGCQKSP
jgi:predicted AAA+ superfamily ATPase